MCACLYLYVHMCMCIAGGGREGKEQWLITQKHISAQIVLVIIMFVACFFFFFSFLGPIEDLS